MKRFVLLKHLSKYGCLLIREGKKHSIFINPKIERVSAVPRHNEIDNSLSRKICKDLDIAVIRRK